MSADAPAGAAWPPVGEGEAEAFRVIAEHASDIVYRAAADGTIVWISPSVEAVLGWRPSEVVGRPFVDLVVPEERDRTRRAWGRYVAAAEPVRGVARILRRDATTCVVAGTIRAARAGDGTILGYVGDLRDITAEVAADEALEQARAELAEAQRVAAIGSWRLDAETMAVTWSDGLYRLHGLEPDPAGRAYEDYRRLMAPADHETLDSLIHRAMRDGTPYEYAYDSTLDDGSHRRFVARGEAVRTADGRIVGARGTLLDVTDARRAELALREAKADLEEAQRVGRVGSWTWDAARDAATWSDEMFRIHGLEIGGRAPSLAEQEPMYTPESWRRVVATNEAGLRTGEPYEIALEVVRPDGEHRYAISRTEPVRGDDGSVIGLRGTLVDVTERRALGARLAEAVRSEEIGRLAGGLAHELGNHITVIAGAAELMADAVPEGDPLRDDIDAVRRSARDAARLTRQLQAFGRTQTLRPTSVDLVATLLGEAPLLHRAAGAAIDLRFEVRPGPLVVRMDRAQLVHALLDLLLDARDAMPGGGTVAFSAAGHEVTPGGVARPGVAAGPYVRLDVLEVGREVDPKALPHLFEPFRAARPGGGRAGLGLAAVEGVVVQSGGWVEAEADDSPSVLLSIYLPAATGVVVGMQTARGGRMTPRLAGCVLLVEGDERRRASASRMLRDLGWSVISEGDATVAAAVGDPVLARVDLLITSATAPAGDGPALAARLRVRRPDLPVLVIGSPTTRGTMLSLPSDPPTVHLAAPFDPDDLAAAVDALVGGETRDPR